MVVVLLSWLWNVLVSDMMGVSGPLVLEVLFVIVGLVVLPRRWLRPSHP